MLASENPTIFHRQRMYAVSSAKPPYYQCRFVFDIQVCAQDNMFYNLSSHIIYCLGCKFSNFLNTSIRATYTNYSSWSYILSSFVKITSTHEPFNFKHFLVKLSAETRCSAENVYGVETYFSRFTSFSDGKKESSYRYIC